MYLLNHWGEFIQTSYIHPHGKGVQEQHYMYVGPFVPAPVVRPSVCHTIFS